MSQSEDETGSGRASADKTRFAAAARGQSAPTQPRMEGRRAARPGVAGRMTVRLEPGDCLDIIPRLVAEGVVVDAVVTDPPYHLTSITARFGAANSAPVKVSEFFTKSGKSKGSSPYLRGSSGFMGKTWDGGDLAFRPETWATIGAIMRPGAFLLAFGGARTFHRIWCAIEDAGFVIQDTICWLYGSGYPKRRDALKPAWEPICLAYKPAGKRSLAVDECRIETPEDLSRPFGNQTATREQGYGYKGDGKRTLQVDECRIPTDDGYTENAVTQGVNSNGSGYRIAKTASKFEPSQAGRWPANVISSGDEVMEAFAAYGDAPGQQYFVGAKHGDRDSVNCYGDYGPRPDAPPRGDKGSAARFFMSCPPDDRDSINRIWYSAKAGTDDRFGSRHPTIKPISLISYL